MTWRERAPRPPCPWPPRCSRPRSWPGPGGASRRGEPALEEDADVSVFFPRRRSLVQGGNMWRLALVVLLVVVSGCGAATLEGSVRAETAEPVERVVMT